MRHVWWGGSHVLSHKFLSSQFSHVFIVSVFTCLYLLKVQPLTNLHATLPTSLCQLLSLIPSIYARLSHLPSDPLAHTMTKQMTIVLSCCGESSVFENASCSTWILICLAVHAMEYLAFIFY